jgi:hypothetical protein
MDLILKLLPNQVIQGWIVTGLIAAVAFLWGKAQLAIAKSNKSAQFKKLADDAGQAVADVLDAEAKATGGKAPTMADLPRLEAVAFALLKARAPVLGTDAEAFAMNLLHHETAVQTNLHSAIVLDPRMATGNFPEAVKIGILLLACLLPFQAMAQIAPGAVPDHWEAGILVPGLKFSLAGASPAAVGAGSGVGFSYLFGKYLYTTKQIDPVTKAPITLPWFGVTFFAQGDVSVLLSGTVSENENAGVGAGLILLNSVTLGWFVDLVSVGSGVTSGLFTNHLSLSNTGPEIFYSVNLGAL